MPYGDLQFAGQFAAKSKFIFAKTLAHNPHSYVLRKNSVSSEFSRFVELIRKYGYRSRYGKSYYTVLNIDEFYFWFMGWPTEQTILVNRKSRKPYTTKNGQQNGILAAYDNIGDKYDKYFHEDVREGEDRVVLRTINEHNLKGNTLEIGCGSGATTRKIAVTREGYVGIDPSIEMLDLFNQDNLFSMGESTAGLKNIHTDFESHSPTKQYDFIFATYGAASYVRPEFWVRLNDMLKPGGTFMLMFFADQVYPKIQEKLEIFIPYYTLRMFPEKEVEATVKRTELGNYTILEGIRK